MSEAQFEKVEKGLEVHIKPNSRCVGCPYPNNGLCGDQLYSDALALIRKQQARIAELEAAPETVPAKLDLDDVQKEWLDGMTAEERLELIWSICVDWDGYRSAAKLGELVNEIWTYAAYPVKKKG